MLVENTMFLIGRKIVRLQAGNSFYNVFGFYRPVSAYALFFRDTQAAIKGQNPNASFGEVSKIVASMWDSLEEDQKNVSWLGNLVYEVKIPRQNFSVSSEGF